MLPSAPGKFFSVRSYRYTGYHHPHKFFGITSLGFKKWAMSFRLYKPGAVLIGVRNDWLFSCRGAAILPSRFFKILVARAGEKDENPDPTKKYGPTWSFRFAIFGKIDLSNSCSGFFHGLACLSSSFSETSGVGAKFPPPVNDPAGQFLSVENVRCLPLES